MGGVMGDAFCPQPVFQAGQMLIILLFLFLQCPWFGLAGVAADPVCGYPDPMFAGGRSNLLTRTQSERVRQLSVRRLGETAAGITDLPAPK